MMIFKDRQEAGLLLAEKIAKTKEVLRDKDNLIVFSLLRGGVVIGAEISKKLKIAHYPLIVAKIPAPYNPELAVGALCFNAVYLNISIVKSLVLNKKQINHQIQIAKKKQKKYLKRFRSNLKDYKQLAKNKKVFLTDDGIATGSTVKAACLFLRSTKAKKVFLVAPVAPIDFDTSGFDRVFILYQDPNFSAVSQFYRSFPQVEDEEAVKFID